MVLPTQKSSDVTEREKAPLAAPPWIPVSERLPENDTEVLCWTTLDVWILAQYWDGQWNGDLRGEMGEPERVTHWMSLPSSPKPPSTSGRGVTPAVAVEPAEAQMVLQQVANKIASAWHDLAGEKTHIARACEELNEAADLIKDFAGVTPAVESGGAEAKWIPCAERYPTEQDFYLIDCSGHVLRCWWDGKNFLGDSDRLRTYFAQHWIPLPNPPAAPEEKPAP